MPASGGDAADASRLSRAGVAAAGTRAAELLKPAIAQRGHATFVAATGVILGAAYMLWLYRRVFFGELIKDELKRMKDLGAREVAIFAPLVAAVFWLGIYPKSFLDVINPAVDRLLDLHRSAVAEACGAAADGAPAACTRLAGAGRPTGAAGTAQPVRTLVQIHPGR